MTATLCGMVQLKPRKPMARAPGDGGREVVRGDFDGQISPVESVMAVGRLHHDLRRVLGDRLAEAGGQFLFEVEHFRHRGNPQAGGTDCGDGATRILEPRSAPVKSSVGKRVRSACIR